MRYAFYISRVYRYTVVYDRNPTQPLIGYGPCGAPCRGHLLRHSRHAARAGEYTVERIETGTPPPAIRPVIITADLPAEARAAIEKQYAEVKTVLNKDKNDFNAWLSLAVLYKIGGDYRGAEAIWLYATKAWPQSPVPFGNLGDLYQNFLNDPVKAKYYQDRAAKLQ